MTISYGVIPEQKGVVIELHVFISCGDEVSPLRDVAVRVLQGLERSFLRGLEIPIVIRNWDYRDEPPEVVAKGEFSARSLRMLSQASVVVGILGPHVPTVTSQELLEGIRRYSAGDADNVLLFLKAATKGPVHRQFLRKILRETDMAVVYQEFEDDLDFQAKLFVALIPYLVRKSVFERQTPIASATGGAA